jgi:hypothetical protein
LSEATLCSSSRLSFTWTAKYFTLFQCVPDLYVFGPPGSGSGFCHQQAKKFRKTLISWFQIRKKTIFFVGILKVICTYRK